jgi:hypothetical protein
MTSCRCGARPFTWRRESNALEVEGRKGKGPEVEGRARKGCHRVGEIEGRGRVGHQA